MNVIIIVVLLVLIAIAAIATIWIGNSKQNKEGNPGYDTQTGSNAARLTFFYILAAIIGCAVLVWYIST